MSRVSFVTYRRNGTPQGVHECEEQHLANALACLTETWGEEFRHFIVADGTPVLSEVLPIHSLNEQFVVTIDKLVIVADGSDTATITGIPAGTTLLVDDTDYSEAIVDGAFEIAVSDEGAYAITLTKDGYDPLTFEVTAS